MRIHEATTVIQPSPEQLWAVLADTAGWNSWNSGVTAVDGRLPPGERIRIHTEAAPGRAFPVAVSTLEPPSRLVLRGGKPLGLFRGVRTYTLTPAGPGATTFTMREEFTGCCWG